jgi:hypothetical protein
MSDFKKCLDDAIVTAMKTGRFPHRAAYVAGYSNYNGGIIHITGISTDSNGEQYATYYLPASVTYGRRYLHKISQFQFDDEEDLNDNDNRIYYESDSFYCEESDDAHYDSADELPQLPQCSPFDAMPPFDGITSSGAVRWGDM